MAYATIAPRAADASPSQRLAAGTVHVWTVDLERVPESLLELLSSAERERVAGILPPARRALWARARALLRVLLARYTGLEADQLRLEVGANGKPRLAGSRPLHFNLSHSGPIALYALSAAGPVGVDVEAGTGPRRRFDELALAARTFGEAEAARLARLDPPDRRREFLRAWTRHEAALKCSGSAASGERPPWVADLGLELGAAVALPRPPQKLRCYRL
jgi:4'-phosphopantetheinyl transferase